MSEILYIQPWDRPWWNRNYVTRRKEIYLSRAQFEVGWQIPDKFGLRFLDLNLALKEGASFREAIVSTLDITKPDLVMVSWPTYVQGDQVRSIINLINSVRPRPIIVGGGTISLVHDKPLHEWQGVSACYEGNGFEIPKLIFSLANSGNITGIPGVYSCYANENNTLPANPSLIDGYSPEEFYTVHGRLNFAEYVLRCRAAGIRPLGIIEMSRGCRFRCNFCAINFVRRGFQMRSPKTVIAEARFLAKHGITKQQLIDPTLGLNQDATMELLEGLAWVAQEFPAFSLEVLTRPEFIKDEFVKMLKRAGVKRCALGMETMEQTELIKVQKTLRVSLTRQAIYKLAEENIRVKLFHILFPRRFSWSTIKFLSELQKQGVKFVVQSSFLRPLAYPESQSNYISYDQTVFVPERDSLDQLMEWMLTNLVFSSMDVGPDGNPELQELIYSCSNPEDLKRLFKVRRDGRELWLSADEHSYGYVHPSKPRAVADCLFVERR